MMRITEKAYYEYPGQWIDVKQFYTHAGFSSKDHGFISSIQVKLREDRDSTVLIDVRIVCLGPPV